MKITALVENQSNCELKATHGLSLYIETQKHKLLFDLGPDDTLFYNAKKQGVNLTKVDTVILSHGHMDHGGALREFLKINSTAKVYVQREAFEPHYSKLLFFKVNVGIDNKLKNHPQIVLADGDYTIDDELSLFTVGNTEKCYSKANDALYMKARKDDFRHEQNLMIKENTTALIMGCGHAGVVNIMEKAKDYSPKVCVGGYHLWNPLTKKTVSEALLYEIVGELQKYQKVRFYTCHCTGVEAFQFLSKQNLNMCYLPCGETMEV
ncbi:MAG TPA: MBL fold metallo-hydrolase [Clostridia bacterium]|nr:MBL fold metallo-hydrolase [Clostridia bacterium]